MTKLRVNGLEASILQSPIFQHGTGNSKSEPGFPDYFKGIFVNIVNNYIVNIYIYICK